MSEVKPLTEERALELTRLTLEATGYTSPDLLTEALESGWKVFAGDDVGAVRVVMSQDSPYFLELDTLMLWWTAPDSVVQRVLDWFKGQPELPPGSHLLWTQVLKARSLHELEAMLKSAQQIRESMLSKAEKRGLKPQTCRLYQYYGNRLSGAGETRDGLRWRAEARHGEVRSLWDSAPLWIRAQRRLRGSKASSPFGGG